MFTVDTGIGSCDTTGMPTLADASLAETAARLQQVCGVVFVSILHYYPLPRLDRHLFRVLGHTSQTSISRTSTYSTAYTTHFQIHWYHVPEHD